MNRLSLLSGILIITLSVTGCTDNGTTLENPNGNGSNTPVYNDNTNFNTPQSVIPEQQMGIGSSYDLATFMFAYPSMNNSGAIKEFMVTTQNSQSTFDLDNRTIKRIQEGLTDTFGDKIVNRTL